ncbi:MAG: 2-C-methyl-D-erythritol 2,4-cyclodiphosphate synthase [Burkholderiales bacterium]|jgi:2-C-methyl-D-erythritol 2,4-cyclodiphosphate synthase|nr:2-C-methyl-D-erythritol 2,4-cyclodiphosphate synthase [Burkholderiales bacterium]
MNQSHTRLRIGQGYDVHALVEDRPLILGGVNIPFERGLSGHSDADALLHAITDALLGAAGMGDIGTHFPDTDPSYAGADSALLLAKAVAALAASGYSIVNIDTTVIAQKPRLGPYIADMRLAIANACSINADQVNVKAKTNEKLGYLGRNEAIEAQAVALIEKQ